MSVVSVVSTLLGFLEHYSTEASAISSGFNSLINELPLSAQDKENIRETLKPVFEAPANIAKALEGFHDTPPVVHISATDIQNAVGAYLTTALPHAVSDYMRDHPVSPPAAT